MEVSNYYSIHSDETGLFDKRFQAIALVSSSNVNLVQLRRQLKDILHDNGIDELKFVEIRTHHPKLLAEQYFIKCVVKDYACRQKCRIDVLVWDTQDTRHAIKGRDNIANLGIMYYRLLTHVARQWKQVECYFYPDVNDEINWDDITKFLNRTSLIPSKTSLPCLFDLEETNELIRFNEIQPTDSLEEPVILTCPPKTIPVIIS